MRKTDKQILDIAIPSIISNITVPLLGLVDVAITGHLGAASYIGAIALGGMLFNIIYWIFAFLRMGTSGLTSQSLGHDDTENIIRMLVRSLAIAFSIAAALLLLQIPIRELGLLIMQPTDEVRRMTVTYFNICIWGAPATLGLFALNGWLIGMQNSRIPMSIAITQNIINILVSLLLVFGIGMRVEGVATGTLIAQWCGFLTGSFLCYRKYFRGGHIIKRQFPILYYLSPTSHAQPASLIAPTGSDRRDFRNEAEKERPSPITYRRFFVLNRDIFLRTLCIVSVLTFFTSAGSWRGEVTLAINTLLMQLYLLVSYVMDGFANAGEAMSGKYFGAGDKAALRATVRRTFFWGMIVAAIFTATYILGGKPFLMILTDEPTVVEASTIYVWWAYLVPFCSVAAFLWDGIFIGLTAARQMLQSMFAATVIFFAVYFLTADALGNHGLWLSFLCYLFVRGVIQTALFPGIMRRLFPTRDI
ncbi:MAG: MATE family efflux transporter [Prevotella sp.]|uniref:MATE family efflux transporter n=1 Tax=Prevotella sp. TaxID=59823 RepID=UPI002A317343|nr:MATE family efflux transporter [Prevotella sp.]MDD7317378.1 MATE family efflux transporter [Prevotellaceae bacterium]MDY4019476.1 MATE family efflux transporter [Prevotella sp.]